MILMINLEVTSWIWKVKMRTSCWGKEIISLNGFPFKRQQLPGFSFIMILICRLRNEYWTFWGFLWGAGELGQRYSFDGWRGACGAYLRQWQQPGYYWCAAREAHGTPDPPNNRIYHNATHSPTFTEKETLPSLNYWLGEFSPVSVLNCEDYEHRALDLVPAKFFLLLCFDLFQPSEMVLIRSLKDDIGVTLMTETGMTLPMMTWHHRCGFGATGCEPGPATDYRNEELFL